MKWIKKQMADEENLRSGGESEKEDQKGSDKRREWRPPVDSRLKKDKHNAHGAKFWKWARRTAIALAVVLLVGGLGLAYYDAGDWTPWFREAKGELASGPVTNEDIKDKDGCAFYDVELGNQEGHRVPCRLSIPLASAGSGPWPAVVLVTSIETGRKMIDLLPPVRKFVLIAPDYPATGGLNFSGAGALNSAWSLRQSATRMVSDVLLTGDFLSKQRIVRKNRVVLLGVNLGAVVSAAAAAADDKGRFNEVVLVQSGADLGRVIAANAQRLKLPLGPTLAGSIGGWLFKPLEPMRYVARISPRPLVMYNAKTNTWMPSEQAQQLFERALNPKKQVWLGGSHNAPEDQTAVLWLTARVLSDITGQPITRGLGAADAMGR